MCHGYVVTIDTHKSSVARMLGALWPAFAFVFRKKSTICNAALNLIPINCALFVLDADDFMNDTPVYILLDIHDSVWWQKLYKS